MIRRILAIAALGGLFIVAGLSAVAAPLPAGHDGYGTSPHFGPPLGSPGQTSHGQPMASDGSGDQPALSSVDAAAMMDEFSRRPAAQKLVGKLKELVAKGGKASGRPQVTVMVEATGEVNLKSLADVAHAWTWPAGEHVAVVRVDTDRLLSLAAMDKVYAITSMEKVDASEPPAIPGQTPRSISLAGHVVAGNATAREQAQAAPPWRPASAIAAANARGERPTGAIGSLSTAIGGPSTPDGWWDVREGHSAMDAWNMGYKGSGVKVAIIDEQIDYAHPDLQGTFAVLPPGHPYAGWPQVFDPYAMGLLAQDKLLTPAQIGQRSTRNGASGMVEAYQTSGLTMTMMNGVEAATACFQPIDFVPISGTIFSTPILQPPTCDFIVPKTSKGGNLRYGHHPDTVLAANGVHTGFAGEYAGVLLVDEHTAGQYDTVYVDIDGDRDFTDEKPMTKADPIGWRDVTAPPDGVADFSAGILYWISDGVQPAPAGWVFGLEKDIPAAGTLVSIQFPDLAAGGHGTLCASNVGSRGRLGVRPDVSLEFRDLPGDHRPSVVNPGMAPEVSMVSIGDAYLSPFPPSWRYAIFGHDVERHDDDIQVVSNSYGFSGVDGDGWDGDSRLIDFYVRTYSPETTFLISAGNGGPGYGTRTAPVPSVAMDVAASTQMGSTGTDSITDTSQINYGDIIPFSGRGPRSAGGNGPDISADGAFAAGAVPINILPASGQAPNGVEALGTWGGTSRSGPVASGTMALIYQAFKAKNGRWPRYDEARSLMMSGARYAAYDVLTMGAGVLDAADSVRIASGKYGVYAMPSELDFDSYTGGKHPAFANAMRPGDEVESSITLTNPTDKPLTVRLSAQQVRRIGSYTQQLVTDRTKESPPSAVPDYLIPIDKAKIPVGTEFMVARGVMENNEEFELPPQQGAGTMNFYRFGVMQHTDINNDGKLWTDKNEDGVVAHASKSPISLAVTWDGVEHDRNSVEGIITRKLDERGVKGDVAVLGFACPRDGQPPTPEQDVKEKIALIERGGCTFVEKIQNAKALGAVAVIVYTTVTQTIAAMAANPGVDPGDLPPGVMISRADGIEIRDQLIAGKQVIAHMHSNNLVLKGIDASTPPDFNKSEIQEYEYERMSEYFSPSNNWTVSIHHPIERWSSGLYLAWWHSLASPVVTNTHISVRVDSYKYQPWTAVKLGQTEVTIPAGKEVKVPVNFKVAAGTAPGMLYGAVFIDYDRSADNPPVAAPGGYELANVRMTIPINAHVLAAYKWKGVVTLGGIDAFDEDAPYNNGGVRGTQNWGWRPESGDWRYFFVDAAEPPPGTYWIFRTQWEDETPRVADIDTRVYGPMQDRYTDPTNAANKDEKAANSDWYGPYGLGLLNRSPYLHLGGGYFAFNTSSGVNDDWIAAPATMAGLHEVMLHNMRFSGQNVDMGFTTDVSSLQITPGVVSLYGSQCQTVAVRPQMDLPGVQLKGYGMSVPEAYKDYPVKADVLADITTSSFRRDITLTQEAVRFIVTLDGEDDDDLDLYLMKDVNNDGMFTYPAERIALSGSPTGDEQINLAGFTQPGHYQVWVHGYTVLGQSKMNLTIDVISGTSLITKNAPAAMVGGEVYNLEVCADLSSLQGQNGPANGVIVFGPGPAPLLFQVPVTWQRSKPAIYVPLAAQGMEWQVAPATP